MVSPLVFLVSGRGTVRGQNHTSFNACIIELGIIFGFTLNQSSAEAETLLRLPPLPENEVSSVSAATPEGTIAMQARITFS